MKAIGVTSRLHSKRLNERYRLFTAVEVTSATGKAVMWIKRILEWLFPGDQLRTLLQMIGVFALIICYGALRAKVWQRHGGSAVFLTKQRFQRLLGKGEDVDDGPQ
jgi:hypothetical protein